MKFLLFLTLIVFSSCKKEKVNYIHLKTIVDSTELRHSGKGYYNEWVFYEFTYKHKKYLKSSKVYGKKRAYNYYYSKGDSVLISFSELKPENSRVLKKIIH